MSFQFLSSPYCFWYSLTIGFDEMCSSDSNILPLSPFIAGSPNIYVTMWIHFVILVVSSQDKDWSVIDIWLQENTVAWSFIAFSGTHRATRERYAALEKYPVFSRIVLSLCHYSLLSNSLYARAYSSSSHIRFLPERPNFDAVSHFLYRFWILYLSRSAISLMSLRRDFRFPVKLA